MNLDLHLLATRQKYHNKFFFCMSNGFCERNVFFNTFVYIFSFFPYKISNREYNVVFKTESVLYRISGKKRVLRRDGIPIKDCSLFGQGYVIF